MFKIQDIVDGFFDEQRIQARPSGVNHHANLGTPILRLVVHQVVDLKSNRQATTVGIPSRQNGCLIHRHDDGLIDLSLGYGMADELTTPGQTDLVVLGHERIGFNRDRHAIRGGVLIYTTIDDFLRQIQFQCRMTWRVTVLVLTARTVEFDQYWGSCRILRHLACPRDYVADRGDAIG
ncbi:hypothetical protein D3C81_777690 [compost metagenome]